MKKNTKTKLVLFSVIGLAAISIGTVGFANWITGIKQENASDSITNIAVDTSNLDTKVVEVKLSDKEIKLTDGGTIGEGKIIYNDNSEAADLIVKFSQFRVVLSEGYTLTNVGIKFALPKDSTGLSVTENGSGIYADNVDGVSTGNTKTYLELPTTILNVASSGEGYYMKSLNNGEPGYISGYSCYALNNMDFTFNWGTLFGNTTPSEYYNSLITESSTLEDKLKTSATADKVLKQMSSLLNEKTINLQITLTTGNAA